MTEMTNIHKDERSKAGNFMFNLLAKAAMPLIKHRWLYWLLNCTWGSLTTLCGCIISLVMLCIGKKPHRWNSVWYFRIGKSWGGLEMGTMFLTEEEHYISINNHELGHTFQNAVLGPFYIFIVGLPSAIRYWARIFQQRKGKKLNDYDTMWFEGSATSIGTYIYENFSKKEEEE